MRWEGAEGDICELERGGNDDRVVGFGVNG